jgi:hypothetical protein
MAGPLFVVSALYNGTPMVMGQLKIFFISISDFTSPSASFFIATIDGFGEACKGLPTTE